MQIPAPSDVTYAKLNETAVEVKWSPTVANPQWSTPVGYVIQVQTSSTSIPASEIVGEKPSKSSSLTHFNIDMLELRNV